MKNYVSLWLGYFSDFDELEIYTEIKYNEDGDSISSVFEKDFKLGYYDRELIEKDWILDAGNNLEKLLVDFSYDEQLIQQFNKVKLQSKYNTIILIYNYNYKKENELVNLVDKNLSKLEFIGVAEYVN